MRLYQMVDRLMSIHEVLMGHLMFLLDLNSTKLIVQGLRFLGSIAIRVYF